VQSPLFKILGLPDNGTYAEFVCVPVENIFPKPTHLTFEESAALPLAGLTAYRAVVSRAKVREGETVLVTGIGGGVATFALLFAKTIGASVVVTSGNDTKINRAVEIGAGAGVNYKNKDWAAELLAATNGVLPDVVIDSAGGETLNVSIDLLKPGGRLVTYGATAGAVKELQVRRIFWKQLSIYGSTMGTPDEFASMLSFVEQYSLHPVIDSVFPLRNAAQAHRRMDESAQFGKIVLSALL
jgi:zinc-binding alcohol dehydrogenase/oxidoreductase